MTIPPFSATFNVPLSCEDCIKQVSTSLHSLTGIVNVKADLKTQLVAVEGTAAPSAIVKAIQDTGRDAVLRGSGTADTAAVCILETFAPNVKNYVRGLIRIVQVAPNKTLLDVSIHGLSPGTYQASLRESGDISRGPESTGGLWDSVIAQREKRPIRGLLGTLEISQGGVGAVFLDKPIEVWEIIGRCIVVSKRDPSGEGVFEKAKARADPDTLVGVVARSAGVWDNQKTVCSCSGKTVWEERREQVGRGMA